MKKIAFFVVIFLSTLYSIKSQSHTDYKISLGATLNLSDVKPSWTVTVKNLENIYVGNGKYARLFRESKEHVERMFPRKTGNSLDKINKNMVYEADSFQVISGFDGNGWGGGTPNDNTLAVSNGNMLVSSVNSNINVYDLNIDSLVTSVSMNAFAESIQGISTHQYDPKLTYDPIDDRFILVFLAGSESGSTNIIIAFSSSNNPRETWNLYTLPGNPLSDSSWFDYPAINLTQNELFLTGNLLMDNGEWQVSFKQSIIWQIDKHKGYQGLPLQTRLWTDISYQGSRLRNIHPVAGGDYLPEKEMYFLNTRNFDPQNDTVFLMHISGTQYEASTEMTIKAVITDKAYGMPPDARQNGTHKLATNDARVLGAFLQNDKIQFVSNTIDTNYGSAGIYHGFITGFKTNNPSCYGNIISDSIIDYGYPNLSYTGKTSTEDQTIITFEYSGKSDTLYPGFCGLFYEGNNKYSNVIKLQKGNCIINLISGTDRWGDYSGSQRKYNEPGKVWVSGTYSIIDGFYKTNATWIAELQSSLEPIIPTPPSFDKKIVIYPNPTSDIVHFDFEASEASIVQFILTDASGRISDSFYTARLPKGRNLISFPIGHLRKGIYFVKMINKETQKILFTEKILVP